MSQIANYKLPIATTIGGLSVNLNHLKIRVLEARSTSAYQREIKPNIIIYGCLEKTEETRESLLGEIANFFKQVLEMEQEIEINDAYRLGQGRSRPILARLKFPNDKAKLFANASKLKGKTNTKKKGYFLQEDLTEQQSELRNFYRELRKENQDYDDDSKLTIKIQRGSLMVNNQQVKPVVVPPKDVDILQLEHDELEEIRAVKLVEGGTHCEKGSDYKCYAFKAKSVNEVRRAYTKVRIKHADATHISAAYRLENPIGPYRQEAIDHGDYGVGRSLLNVLKTKEIEHLGVFLVRYYGNVQLGKRRFEIAEQMAEAAVRVWFTRLAKTKRSQRQNSQASIASTISQLSLEETDQAERQDVEQEEEVITGT